MGALITRMKEGPDGPAGNQRKKRRDHAAGEAVRGGPRQTTKYAQPTANQVI
jgi:hypothetical protein